MGDLAVTNGFHPRPDPAPSPATQVLAALNKIAKAATDSSLWGGEGKTILGAAQLAYQGKNLERYDATLAGLRRVFEEVTVALESITRDLSQFTPKEILEIFYKLTLNDAVAVALYLVAVSNREVTTRIDAALREIAIASRKALEDGLADTNLDSDSYESVSELFNQSSSKGLDSSTLALNPLRLAAVIDYLPSSFPETVRQQPGFAELVNKWKQERRDARNVVKLALNALESESAVTQGEIKLPSLDTAATAVTGTNGAGGSKTPAPKPIAPQRPDFNGSLLEACGIDSSTIGGDPLDRRADRISQGNVSKDPRTAEKPEWLQRADKRTAEKDARIAKAAADAAARGVKITGDEKLKSLPGAARREAEWQKRLARRAK